MISLKKTTLFLFFIAIIARAEVNNYNNSVLFIIPFKKNTAELDSNFISRYYNVVKYLKDTSYCKKYKVEFKSYITFEEYKTDKKLGVKRFKFLKNNLEREICSCCRISFSKEIEFVKFDSVSKINTGLVYYAKLR